MIQEEQQLTKTLRRKLSRAKIKTFRQLARHKPWTLIRKTPGLYPQDLESLSKALQARSLAFSPDDTIIPSDDLKLSKVHRFWDRGYKRYRGLRHLYLCEIEEIAGGKKINASKNLLVSDWLEKNDIPHRSVAQSKLCQSGFTEETAMMLICSGIQHLRDLRDLPDTTLASIFYGDAKMRSFTQARIRETDYVLWKNGLRRPHRPL
ncbi:MAG: hypothetical protein KC877_01895 [Candidatus Kaiserbacteria bacterium]|nr:hypothetical protein [Candidatus Kaiserbacteria bacterium]